MGAFKRNRGVRLFGSLTAMRSMGIALCAVGVITLICAFGCEQRTGLLPSGAEPGQAEPAKPAEPAKETVAEAPSPGKLKNSYCVACHPVQPDTIAKQGAKHKSKVGCVDCHTEHPPAGTDPIPECSMCHSAAPHYELPNCSSCHTDTHAPLDLTLDGELTEPCLTCHKQQGDEVQTHPSAHTDVPCNECHAVHREIPDCMDCHEKHTEDMDFEACLACHPVHMPTLVKFVVETPSPFCRGCHPVAVDLLDKNPTKHHELACAFCHKGDHKTIPPCTDCHPDQHPKAILEKFPECGHCHGIAHDVRG